MACSSLAREAVSGFAFPAGCCRMTAMAFDPANPPIWLRKLHVTAAQISPDDYPASPLDGLLAVCRLSDAQYHWMSALRRAIDGGDGAVAPPSLA
jgi:hypothetical protein